MFVISERSGVWGKARPLPGVPRIYAYGDQWVQPGLVSCPAPGDCVAVGGLTRAFLVTQRDGTWGPALPVPGVAALAARHPASVAGVSCSADSSQCAPRAESVSCPAPGRCSVAGTFVDSSGRRQVFVASEQSGAWGRAMAVPGLAALNRGGSADVTQLSCASPGNCAAGGWYRDRMGRARQQAWADAEVAGRWRMTQKIPGLARLNAGEDAAVLTVSCGRPGDCVAGGYYALRGEPGDFTSSAFLIRERSGSWDGPTPVPGLAALGMGRAGDSQVSSLSCVPGWCTAVGTYSAANGISQFFVLNLR